VTVIDFREPTQDLIPPLDRSGDGGVAELVAAAAGASDANAWEALVHRFGRMVFSIARSYRLSEADVADVSQTVWLRLVEHAGRLTQPERVGAWLATTTRNEALRVSRMAARTAPVADPDALGPVKAYDDEPPVEAEERRTLLRTAVAGLPAHQRQLAQLLMSHTRPSYEEVSASLGIPVGSIGPTRQRTLRALRSKCISASI
jgi:RNA polymerase sigma factor (sigma-70 family)